MLVTLVSRPGAKPAALPSGPTLTVRAPPALVEAKLAVPNPLTLRTLPGLTVRAPKLAEGARTSMPEFWVTVTLLVLKLASVEPESVVVQMPFWPGAVGLM